MVKFYARDRELSQEELDQFKKQPNENKKFKFLYGAERLEQFKKYKDRFPEDQKDMNYWIKPSRKGGNDFLPPRDFDKIIKRIQEEDTRRAEQRALEAQEPDEEREERLRREEQARKEGQNITPIVNGPGVEYLGADEKYRVYRVTSYEGAHNFALPGPHRNARRASEMNTNKGWCITGSGYWGTRDTEGPHYWDIEVPLTKDGAFYFFMTTPAKDSYCVFKNRSGGLTFVDNWTDKEKNTEPTDAKLPLEIAGMRNGEIKYSSSVREVTGPFYVRGTTLIGLTDEGKALARVALRADMLTIGANAICGCRNLKKLEMTSNTKVILESGVSANILLEEIIFRANTMTFSEKALEYNGNLLHLDFPSNANIPDKLLRGCIRLQRVTLPTNLTSIGKEAFEKCSSLITLEIPSTCTIIGENAFNGCKSLILKAHFDKKPDGWYDDIENQVKEIIWLEKPEEETPVEEIPVEEIQAEEVVAEDSVDDTDDIRVLDAKTKKDEKKKSAEKHVSEDTRVKELKRILKKLESSDLTDNQRDALEEKRDLLREKLDKEGVKYSLEDSKCNDVKPKKGEKKKEFLQRFMKETEKEYPDEKQRYAVANSYWERKKVKDAESIVEIKDKDAEKEEVVEDKTKKEVVTFTIQTLKKEALNDLKASKNKNDLDERYDKWLEKSEDLVETGKITIDQQEAFEDELWEIYKNIDLK